MAVHYAILKKINQLYNTKKIKQFEGRKLDLGFIIKLRMKQLFDIA
jgi:hypothetical protein